MGLQVGSGRSEHRAVLCQLGFGQWLKLGHHKSGIIDIVQTDNINFDIGKEMSAREDLFWYAPQGFFSTRRSRYEHRA